MFFWRSYKNRDVSANLKTDSNKNLARSHFFNISFNTTNFRRTTTAHKIVWDYLCTHETECTHSQVPNLPCSNKHLAIVLKNWIKWAIKLSMKNRIHFSNSFINLEVFCERLTVFVFFVSPIMNFCSGSKEMFQLSTYIIPLDAIPHHRHTQIMKA